MAEPVRVIGMGDLHLGLTRYGTTTGAGNSRVADFEATLERFVDAALDHEVHIAAFLGDTFNSRHETPGERAAFSRGLWRLRAAGILVVVLSGNHDGNTTVGDASTSALRYLEELRMPGVVVVTKPMRSMVFMDDGLPLVDLTAYPYPHKGAFDTLLADVHPDDRTVEAGKRLEATIKQVTDSWLPGQSRFEVDGPPRVFMGHLSVGNALVGSEGTMRFAWDVAVSSDCLLPFDGALLGHIHKQQALPGGKAWYTGSPEYIDFSEVGDPKGFLLMELGSATAPTVTVIPSGARPMLVFEVAPDYPVEFTHLDGAIVLLRIHVADRPDQAAISGLQSRLMRAGASYVKVELIRAEVSAAQRIEVEADLSIMEATRRWLAANGHPEEPAMTAASRLIAAQAGGDVA